MSESQRLPFEPVLPDGGDARALFLDFARELAGLPEFENARERNLAVEACRQRAANGRGKCDAAWRQAYLAAVHVLADLATDLQAARLLVYAAARSYDAGAPRGEITRSAAMAP